MVRGIKDLDFQLINQREYWLKLCPNLSITEKESTFSGSMFDPPPHSEELNLKLEQDGYLQWDHVLPLTEVQKLAQCITHVKAATGFPVFCFVYDAFWSFVPRLQHILSPLWREDWLLLPNFWAWKLEHNDKGWPPHRDRAYGAVHRDGHSDVLTLWIALSEATPDNGCIYVVPANADPFYHQKKGHYTHIASLQDIRALPLTAGSMLAWTPQLLHWGGRSNTQATEPRISIGYELQRSNATAYDIPLLQPQTLPDFHTRLALIGRQLHQYREMYTMTRALQHWAKQWKKKLPGCSLWERLLRQVFRK